MPAQMSPIMTMPSVSWRRRLAGVPLVLCLVCSQHAGATATDELVSSARHPDGSTVPYVLTLDQPDPAFIVILMPGGVGVVAPEMKDGKLVMRGKGNFLIRSRALFAGQGFAAVSTDATSSPERMTAILEDLGRRFPKAAVYIIGTSRSTYSTMRLAEIMDGRVAGFVHTSSMNPIAVFDPRGLKSRNLIVHHRNDTCRVTGYASAVSAHERYGAELITIEGGISEGDTCEALAHHGYNGVEKETVERIKAWIRR
jgi:hypothetical protein